MGVKAIRCDSLDELPAKMKEFIEYDNNKPILFEARVVKNEHVFPMVSPRPVSLFDDDDDEGARKMSDVPFSSNVRIQ